MLLDQEEKHRSIQGSSVTEDKSPSADRKYRDLEPQLVALRQKNSDLEGKLEQAKVLYILHAVVPGCVCVCDACFPMYACMYMYKRLYIRI